VTPELHTGIAATPTGHKAWVVGLSPYTPAIGAWDESGTFSTKDKAATFVNGTVGIIRKACTAAGVTFKVRHWLDGVEQP
jgi:hypothetical protein